MADLRRGVVGIDIAAASLQVDDGFCHLWFTPRERQWADRDRAKRCADLWAIKEAVFKAAGDGRGWNPREIEIIPQGTSGFEGTLRGRKLGGLQIELEAHDDQVVAIAFVPRALAAAQAIQERSGQTKQVTSSARSNVRAARFVNCAVRGSRVR
jgi:phosphopantetheinyl transferase (holo-ACP synthase)